MQVLNRPFRSIAAAVAILSSAVTAGCGSAAMLSKYGPVQYVDIHFMNGVTEISGGQCRVGNAEGSHIGPVPGAIPAAASYSTLLVRCDAPGTATGYVDADFAAGYPAQLLVRPGQERQYKYNVTSNTWDSDMLRFTDTETAVEAHTHTGDKILQGRVARFAGASRLAAEAASREKAAAQGATPPQQQ